MRKNVSHFRVRLSQIMLLYDVSTKSLWLIFLSPRKGRSNRSLIFFKIGLLKNFANFTEKHLWWSLFLIKIIKQTPTEVFSREILKIFINIFFTKHFRWLLLQGVCEGTSLVKILQSCHFNIFGTNYRCFRMIPFKKDKE